MDFKIRFYRYNSKLNQTKPTFNDTGSLVRAKIIWNEWKKDNIKVVIMLINVELMNRLVYWQKCKTIRFSVSWAHLNFVIKYIPMSLIHALPFILIEMHFSLKCKRLTNDWKFGNEKFKSQRSFVNSAYKFNCIWVKEEEKCGRRGRQIITDESICSSKSPHRNIFQLHWKMKLIVPTNDDVDDDDWVLVKIGDSHVIDPKMCASN